MNITKSPCKDCPDFFFDLPSRTRCSFTCERYAEWLSKEQEIKSKIYREKNLSANTSRVQYHGLNKSLRRK